MQITCTQCGKTFEFSEGEIKFYLEKGFSYPKRCKECRNNNAGVNLGYKQTNIYDNSKLYGLPAYVGADVIREYIVQMKVGSSIYYAFIKDKRLYFTEKRENATVISQEEIKMFNAKYERKLREKYPNIEIKSISLAHYEDMRVPIDDIDDKSYKTIL